MKKLKKKSKSIKKKTRKPKRRYTSAKFKGKDAKNSKRSRTKFRALIPELNLKSRYDLIEIDDKYWDALKKDPKAMEYLNKFNEEFVNASFNKHKKHLHKTKNMKRDVYNKNNARNRCIYTKEKAQGKLEYVEDIIANIEEEFIEYETELIDAIDTNLRLDKELNNTKKSGNNSDDSTNS